MLAEILKENNVNSEGMRFDPGARTALAFVTLRSDGEREFMFYRNPSADMLLQEAELDLDLIRKVCEVYTCNDCLKIKSAKNPFYRRFLKWKIQFKYCLFIFIFIIF
jgi:sugar/nucleoside kinase (ribokinase family)